MIRFTIDLRCFWIALLLFIGYSAIYNLWGYTYSAKFTVVYISHLLALALFHFAYKSYRKWYDSLD